jgi:IclR family transcriptional regulator, mhp operon transcriptional activator
VRELLDKVVWPMSLSVLAGDSMVIRDTTHGLSRASFHRNMVGQRAPLLVTAAGRACLAFLSSERRNAILRRLRGANDRHARLARDKRFVTDLVRKVRSAGYAVNSGDWERQPKTAAVAMPILYRKYAVASLNIVYLKSALPEQEAIRKYVPTLREAVTEISRSLSVSRPGGSPNRNNLQ